MTANMDAGERTVFNGKAVTPGETQCSRLERLAEKEWSDDRDRLLSYYEENQQRLDAIPFGDVAAHMSPIVAGCFLGSTWKTLASSLGIPDTQLEGIEERARRVDLRPLQVALQELYPRLDACCQSNSVGHLVAVLRESERLDVLYKLLPPIRDKLKAKNPERDGLFANGGSWPPQKGLRADSFPSLDSGVGLSLGEETAPAWGAALPIAPVGERRELRLLPSLGEDQVHRPPSDIPDGGPAGVPEDDADKDEDEPCLSLLDTLLPKGSADGDDDCLTVLVNHLEEDCGMARELARRLEEDHGCQVLTQEQLQPARHMDPLLIEELVAKVDAIVPLVSSAYLRHHRQIRRTGRVQSDDSSATHELYCLLQHRLVSSSCLCHMIFPARAPGVSYGQVRGHFIFSKSLPLWGDVPRLALLMRDCRRLRNIRQEPI